MTNENDMNNLPAEAWEPLQQQEKDAEKIARPSLTFFQDGWRRLKDNKVAMISMVAIIVMARAAAAASSVRHPSGTFSIMASQGDIIFLKDYS